MLEAAWDMIVADPAYSVHAELDALGTESKLFIVRLYETATGKVLLPPDTDRAALAGLLDYPGP